MSKEFKLPQPPEDITPNAFFSDWLPAQIGDFKDMIKEVGSGISASSSVRVTGDNGGEWAIGLDNGEVAISEGLKDDSLVTITISEGNFVEAVTGKRAEVPLGMPGGAAGGMDPLKAIEEMKSKMDALKNISGSFQFKIDDDSPFAATIKFAGPMTEEPTATIIINSETATELATGELNPQAAFMSGKLQIQGDMGLLMQLAQFMM